MPLPPLWNPAKGFTRALGDGGREIEGGEGREGEVRWQCTVREREVEWDIGRPGSVRGRDVCSAPYLSV